MDKRVPPSASGPVNGLPTTDNDDPDIQRKRLTEFEIITFVLSCVGLLLAVVFLGGRVGRVATEIVVGLLLLTIVIMCRRLLRRYLHGAIAAAVLVLLGLLTFHFWRDSRRTFQPSPPSEIHNQPSANVDVQNDQWRDWTVKVQREVKACPDRDDPCLATVVSANHNYPPATSSNPVDHLNADIRAGAFLMSIPPVMDMLVRQVSIQRNFLGDGFSTPEDDKNYWKARVPEFLIRNYLDTNPRVWTWSLDPDKVGNKKLSDVINSPEGLIAAARNRNHPDFLGNIKSHLSLTDEAPAVVRLQRFPESTPDGKRKYLGTIGKPGAKRTFVMHLGTIYNSTVREAVLLSGFQKKNESTKDDRLWIWVYTPAQGELDRANWDYIIRNVEKWVSEPKIEADKKPGATAQ